MNTKNSEYSLHLYSFNMVWSSSRVGCDECNSSILSWNNVANCLSHIVPFLWWLCKNNNNCHSGKILEVKTPKLKCQPLSEGSCHFQLLALPLACDNTPPTCLHHNADLYFCCVQPAPHGLQGIGHCILFFTGQHRMFSSQYFVIFEKNHIFQTRNRPQVLGFRTWAFYLGYSLSSPLPHMKITSSGTR